MEKLAISVRELAEVLGVSKSHAYELVKTGVVPSVKLGKRIVIPVNKLQGILEGGK